MNNKINWFPGHMKKAIDEINQIIKQIDVIIEVLDARAITSSSNPDFLTIFKNKIHLQVALKSDLANSLLLENNHLLISNIYDKNLKNQIINKLQSLLNEKILRYQKKGLINPKFSILVCGLPNIGKSSLINLLKGKNILEAKNTPGVTKRQQKVSINKMFDLIDTPGIFVKNINDKIVAYKLCLINCINLNVIPIEEVLSYGFDYLNENYQKSLLDYYKINEYINFNNFINKIKSNYITKNHEVDYNKLYIKLFKDISEAKICKLNWDK